MGGRQGPATGRPVPGPVVGVLLAAGAGRRFGMPKVMACDGEWLRSAVDALARGGCDRVVVVLGAAVVEVPDPAVAVINEDWADGLSSSVRHGLLAARAQGASRVVIHLVDLPGVGPQVIRRVLSATDEVRVARASYGGRPGHPVAFREDCLSELLASLAGDRGAGRWLSGPGGALPVPCADLADGMDRDTPGAVGVPDGEGI
ncbi:nicotine blue oxidoreductase [Austwickia chelonae]|uniref:MobA-like NTP transferase domain-containing protein n=1 Tax=Austwickia chelonae NBRC 105200 TaxID=1184607 RepID=K6VLF0_9MICO|nr:NTP transferase domain-containing protein [Austwickia chelonae]GAB77529.1 hypothetical protein AUCHE_05_04410 [Austwickia chelonae NBRC 105200]SEW12237.1 nicotine blue oxidoreductase [Austwickia chelonae]